MKPRKRFGQHFLKDETIIQKLLHLVSLKRDDNIIEIGPGKGALTFPLLKQVNHLNAIEIDRDIVKLLKEKCLTNNNISIYEQDVLTFNFNKLKIDERPLRIIGNLPYNISTPLIFHLLTFSSIIKDMYFMLQKEVAERLCATPHHKNYGRLSIMTQLKCSLTYLIDVPAHAFHPAPLVESSIIKMVPYATPPFNVLNEELLVNIVKDAFNHRRKTIRNSLHKYVPALSHLNISLTSRAEDLTIKNYVDLANLISAQAKT